MIRAFFWLPADNSVGHSAAEIGAGEPYANYVSWWPTKTVRSIRSVPGFSSPPRSADVREMKREPDRTLDIDGLDEEEASVWWTNFTRKPDAKYALPTQNCSWAVVNALKVGGADKFFPWHQIFERLNVPLSAIDVDAAFQKMWEHGFRYTTVFGRSAQFG